MTLEARVHEHHDCGSHEVRLGTCGGSGVQEFPRWTDAGTAVAGTLPTFPTARLRRWLHS
ncbi:MAG: hypothetical protein WAW17_24385 [Rhodococcus sp. (in: high G+C Gram-positive bacteria)]|uniref:hypothetical protein n=1 Tax=Rhodococcus sp. TaxID=1831 RepID=UPI003BB14B52